MNDKLLKRVFGKYTSAYDRILFEVLGGHVLSKTVNMKRANDDKGKGIIIVEVHVIASMKQDEYICRLLFGAEGGGRAFPNEESDVSSRLLLRDTPQTHCDCKAGNDVCAHVGAALMVLRAVQVLDMESWDVFHRTCPESVKSLMDYPIPADFAYSREASLQDAFNEATNKKISGEEGEPEDPGPQRDVACRVVSYFRERLKEVQKGHEDAHERENTGNNDTKDEEGEKNAPPSKLTDITAQLDEAIRDAHLRNGVDDTFEHKVEQAKVLLRLQTLYEEGRIRKNLLVGGYTAIMKEELQRIVDLADQVSTGEEEADVDRDEEEIDSEEEEIESIDSNY